MLFAARYSDYDPIAWFYNRYWGNAFVTQFYDVIERTALARLAKGATVLDLCCGSGQLAARLSADGFRVTGLDGSAGLLRFARENAPAVELVAGDARSFTIIEKFDAVLCTYDSLNHVPDLMQLASVFNNVYACLRKEGQFLFDLNMEEGFKARWHGASSVIEPDHVLATNASYDSASRQATMAIAAFTFEKRWKRTDVRLVERCYPREDIMARLSKSLFRNVKTFDAQRDFAKADAGRTFFLSNK